MKKIIFTLLFAFSSLITASEYKYELTPLIGYNIAEGNLNLKDSILVGAEVQYNGYESKIKPELSFLYADSVKSEGLVTNEKTKMYRFALNGVYELEKIDSLTPFVKAGLGYESMSNHIDVNRDAAFVDAGAGVKAKITDAIALKAEAIYSLKYNKQSAGANMGDSNLALLAGVVFSFGETNNNVAPVAAAVIDGDDDNDGVKNSMDKCPNTKPGLPVNSDGCFVDGDDDNDGVANSLDKCPNSPKGTVVDKDGCEVIIDLHVKFKHNSYSVDSDSLTRIQAFAKFLVDFPKYSAQIIGHTNSIGSASSNQVLSENRANAVRDLIIKEGVDASRVTAVGKGESSPMTTNDTPEGLAENRRIEATLSK